MAKIPWNVIKAGAGLTGMNKKIAKAAASAPEHPTAPVPTPNDFAFNGDLYDVTVVIEAAASTFENSKFVPGTSVHSKIHLEGDGHPLVLPLDRLHPGFVGNASVDLQNGMIIQAVKCMVMAADSVESKEWASRWSGNCVSDGSGFRLHFVIPIPPHPWNDIGPYEALRGYIEGVRSKN